jgi:4-diphosphocytidyl-2-C-methyl-D-erythritol kinase
MSSETKKVLHTQISAPAKINLWLRVMGRRQDGYHELDSVFCRLDWGDSLQIRFLESEQTTVDCHCTVPQRSHATHAPHPELSSSDNLAAKAALAMLEHSNISGYVSITLEKNTWIAAGLGGGSSDAAAVLIALDDLFSSRFSHYKRPDLPALAKQLGADVPFFLGAPVARARGIGEKLEPLCGFPSLDLVLVNPGQPLSTPAVFEQLGLQAGQTLRDEIGMPERYDDLAHLLTFVGNDLEPPALAIFPQISELKALLLEKGALVASLSGSGPTVFGVFESQAAAERASRDIAGNHGLLTIATTTCAGLTPAK